MFDFFGRILGELDQRFGLRSEQTYLYCLRQPGRPQQLSSMGLTWAPLSLEDGLKLREIGPFEISLAAPRFARGDLCYGGYIDGRLAHYSWVQRSGLHRIHEAGLSETVAPGEFWIYHCRTAEWARGRGIYPATLARIVGDLFDSGDKAAWIYTTRENISSQKGIARAGFQQVKTLPAVRFGGHYYPRRLQGQ
jgi:hypothetical protein